MKLLASLAQLLAKPTLDFALQPLALSLAQPGRWINPFSSFLSKLVPNRPRRDSPSGGKACYVARGDKDYPELARFPTCIGPVRNFQVSSATYRED